MIESVLKRGLVLLTGILMVTLYVQSADALTKEDLAEAIGSYIKSETALRGGYFTFYDKVTEEPLALTLVKIHKDRLSTVGKNTHFFCVDLKATNGNVYDLDFFMKGTDKDHLTATEVTLHKINGSPLYTWYHDKKEGVWKKKWKDRTDTMKREIVLAMGSSGKEEEHPEEKGAVKEEEHPEEKGAVKKEEHPEEKGAVKEEEHPEEEGPTIDKEHP